MGQRQKPTVARCARDLAAAVVGRRTAQVPEAVLRFLRVAVASEGRLSLDDHAALRELTGTCDRAREAGFYPAYWVKVTGLGIALLETLEAGEPKAVPEPAPEPEPAEAA